ncbi:MAG TPA: CHAT domain-containing protein [Thermoanaerobaculia bacterium]|nr:CHAT domain-containing protein [Thermoanaerobaculia bacterium]
MKSLGTGHQSLEIVLASGLLLACQMSASDAVWSERAVDGAQGASTTSLERTELELERARSAYLKALDAMERPPERDYVVPSWWGPGAAADLRDELAASDHKTVDRMLEIASAEVAFEVLERYRVKSILMGQEAGTSLLARLYRLGTTRGSETAGDPVLQEIGARIDAITRALDKLPETGGGQEALLAERARLQDRRHQHLSRRVDREIYDAIEEPVTWDIVRTSLDPGTVLLSYSVGPKHTDLFVVTPHAPIEWHRLPVSAEVLRGRIEGFAEGLGLHQRGVERIFSPTDPETRTALARWLFDILVVPAGDRLVAAQRVLILPDGPLHRLPFAALMRPAENGRYQYLVEWKPVHLVQSLAAYIELRGRRPAEGAKKKEGRGLLALGDPVYPEPHTVRRPLPWAVRSALRRSPSAGLQPLPNTAREVSAIGSLFAQAAEPQEALLAANATEEAVKQRLGRARYVHLAVHGFADDRQPDHSFLALSIPEDLPEGRENGILEIWEIIDRLHFDADLVTLSACVTALGPEYSGEGLMSLSRAFQIAGARSVLASLWRVDDESTAELMIRFYRHLLSGMSKDEALRAAQSDLIRGPIQVPNQYGGVEVRDFTAPYYWAAFQLFGDWQ